MRCGRVTVSEVMFTHSMEVWCEGEYVGIQKNMFFASVNEGGQKRDLCCYCTQYVQHTYVCGVYGQGSR